MITSLHTRGALTNSCALVCSRAHSRNICLESVCECGMHPPLPSIRRDTGGPRILKPSTLARPSAPFLFISRSLLHMLCCARTAYDTHLCAIAFSSVCSLFLCPLHASFYLGRLDPAHYATHWLQWSWPGPVWLDRAVFFCTLRVRTLLHRS